MLKSMTGYGRAQGNQEQLDISVEIKSVNHRYLEFSSKIPKAYLFLEDALKKKVQNTVNRGKVELLLTVTSDGGKDMNITLDEAAVEEYLSTLREAGRKFGLQDNLQLSDLLQLPDIFVIKKADINEEAVTEAVLKVTEEALLSYEKMRCAEGEKLKEDLENKLNSLEEMVAQVEVRAPELQQEYYNRLYAKLSETLQDANVDESRLVTEAAIFADKVAVDEETVRLRSHLHQFRSMLKSEGPVGKKLDFLVQEMNRETNTIGSKGQDVQIARTVVEMKSEIEKIREQIQNIE